VRVALDTNVLAYAEGINGAKRRAAALDVIEALPAESVVVPVQALGELFNVLVLKTRRPVDDTRGAILAWRDAFAVVDTTQPVLVKAADLAVDHGLRIWDAIMLAAAAEAGCRLFLSEDLQDGFTWQGVTVVNPFASEPHALLAALLE
jgi:predicted nucleic acid-binding protein